MTSKSGYWSRLCKDLRRTLHLTPAQTAERLGIDQASVSRWDRGSTEPHYEMRVLIEALAQGSLATLGNIVATRRG